MGNSETGQAEVKSAGDTLCARKAHINCIDSAAVKSPWLESQCDWRRHDSFFNTS